MVITQLRKFRCCDHSASVTRCNLSQVKRILGGVFVSHYLWQTPRSRGGPACQRNPNVQNITFLGRRGSWAFSEWLTGPFWQEAAHLRDLGVISPDDSMVSRFPLMKHPDRFSTQLHFSMHLVYLNEFPSRTRVVYTCSVKSNRTQ